MNDTLIRQHFHRQRLKRFHASPDAIVLDELGLKHGKCRADIAVINGRLVGYEIKSNEDSLRRLAEQVEIYSAVFDRASVIVGAKHANSAQSLVPDWWGVIVCDQGTRGGLSFKTLRRASSNAAVDPFSLAQLLWREEAASILEHFGEPQVLLRQRRSVLYERMAEVFSLSELRCHVTTRLKERTNWRCRASLSRYGG